MPYIGLTTEQAKNLLYQNGLNTLADVNPIKPLGIFFAQFKSILILILLFASVLAYFLGDFVDALFILIIVLLNAIFGFVQEFRAEKAIKALKNMVKSQVRVFRDGKETLLDPKYLVPGDHVILEEGTRVPADCQLLEIASLEVDESSLTGESAPIPKIVDDDSDEGKVFLGTTVVRGHGLALVFATGERTKFGQIAQLLASIPDEPTPLQKQLSSLGKILAYFALLSTFFIFILGILKGANLLNMLLTSVSLAVAVVPEGLPAVLTVTLALGVQRMTRKKAVVRTLSSIETLGSTNVICTDKTGTLTQNKMSVKSLWLDFEITGVDVKKSKLLDQLARIAVLANNANTTTRIDDASFEVVGEKTEASLLSFAHRLDYSIENLRLQGKLLEEFPFDSGLKAMSVLWKEKSLEVLSKGAPEVILENSTQILQKNGKTRKLTLSDRENILKGINTLASKGDRIIAFAYKKATQEKLARKEAETDLVFVGLVGISDPIRPEVREAITLASQAGIRTIMITGDNPLTACTIGLEAGIITSVKEVFPPTDFGKLTDLEVREAVIKYSIFARINPVDKNRIVKALQSQGYVVAVTGDGVNDAPALKQADVGVAMAITGTDVAKEAADIVLTDDNYATLISAVEEGRVIYDNILKSLKFLLSSNSSELFVILTAVFLGVPLPLTPVQILWINLVSDSLPALALATDPKDPQVMTRLPRDKTVGIIKLIDPYWLLKIGILVAGVTVTAFLVVLQFGSLEQARMVSFTLLILLQLGIALIVRWPHPWHTNKRLLLAISLIVFLQAAILLHPSLREIFDISGS